MQPQIAIEILLYKYYIYLSAVIDCTAKVHSTTEI